MNSNGIKNLFYSAPDGRIFRAITQGEDLMGLSVKASTRARKYNFVLAGGTTSTLLDLVAQNGWTGIEPIESDVLAD
jgi:hypothetical protein